MTKRKADKTENAARAFRNRLRAALRREQIATRETETDMPLKNEPGRVVGNVQEMTNAAGKTLRVGQRVTHTDGWAGTIYAIRSYQGITKIHVNPDNINEVRDGTWRLSASNAKLEGKEAYCRVRDHGVSMGHFKEAWPDPEIFG